MYQDYVHQPVESDECVAAPGTPDSDPMVLSGAAKAKVEEKLARLEREAAEARARLGNEQEAEKSEDETEEAPPAKKTKRAKTTEEPKEAAPGKKPKKTLDQELQALVGDNAKVVTPDEAKALRKKARDAAKEKRQQELAEGPLPAVGSKEQHPEPETPTAAGGAETVEDSSSEDEVPLDKLSKPKPPPVTLDTDEEATDTEMVLAPVAVRTRVLPPTLENLDLKGLELIEGTRYPELRVAGKRLNCRIVKPLGVVGRIRKNNYKKDEFEAELDIEMVDETFVKKIDKLNVLAYNLAKKKGMTQGGRVWKPLSHPTVCVSHRGVQVRFMTAKITDRTTIVIVCDSTSGDAPKILDQGEGLEFFEKNVSKLKNLSITGEISFTGVNKCTVDARDGRRDQCGVNKPAFWQLHRRVQEGDSSKSTITPLSQKQIDDFFAVV